MKHSNSSPARIAGVLLRVFAVVFGTLPIAVLLAVCAARFLPLAEDASFATAFCLAIPLWIGAMCLAFLVTTLGVT